MSIHLRFTRLRAAAVALAALTAGTGVALAPAAAHAASPHSYTFRTLDDQADPTFNQLLGINNSNVISGYFGKGSHKHPNKGYVLNPPYGQGNYTNENFPGSVQTQVVAINNTGDTAGFWVQGNGTNKGFIDIQRCLHLVHRPQHAAHARQHEPDPGHQRPRHRRRLLQRRGRRLARLHVEPGHRRLHEDPEAGGQHDRHGDQQRRRGGRVRPGLRRHDLELLVVQRALDALPVPGRKQHRGVRDQQLGPDRRLVPGRFGCDARVRARQPDRYAQLAQRRRPERCRLDGDQRRERRR